MESGDFLELSDGELKTEDGLSFLIHKFELAKKSEYFFRLFLEGTGRGKKVYTIPRVSGEILSAVLSFMDAGELRVTESNLIELLSVAEQFSLSDLAAYIGKAYDKDRLTVSNCLPIFLEALKADCRDIVKAGTRFIMTHFESVADVHGSAMSGLPEDVLVHFLRSSSLCVRDESTVWRVSRAWVQADVKNRLHLVPALLEHLAFQDVTEDLAGRILRSRIVKDNPHCKFLFESQHPTKKDVLQSIAVLKQNQSSPGFLASVTSALFSPVSWMTHTVSQSSSETGSHDHLALRSRMPTHVHLIAHVVKSIVEDTYVYSTHVYATYDERIDLWRKLAELDYFPRCVSAAGNDVYAYIKHDVVRYSVIEKEVTTLPDLRAFRTCFALAHLDGSLYAVGGTLSDFDDAGNGVADVEAYDPQLDCWQDVAPLVVPCDFVRTATLGRRIYAIGAVTNAEGLPQMIAQMYNPDADAWTRFPAPRVPRGEGFAVAEYRGQLFVLGGQTTQGGVKSVEVFDPRLQKWLDHEPLPHAFDEAQAVVLNGHFIVHEGVLRTILEEQPNPPLMLDEGRRRWMYFDEACPMNSLHEYHFLQPGSDECRALIGRENKDPENAFAKSPFASLYY